MENIQYTEIEGDLISLAQEGRFDVISHGCNCFCTMGGGIAPQMAKAFGCDNFNLEQSQQKGKIDKLGRVDYQHLSVNKLGYQPNGGHPQVVKSDGDIKYNLFVVNSYTQYNYGMNYLDGTNIPFDYHAFTLCMKKINHTFKGSHIGLPKIGSGLAGGNWDRIKGIIQRELKDCKTTIVILK